MSTDSHPVCNCGGIILGRRLSAELTPPRSQFKPLAELNPPRSRAKPVKTGKEPIRGEDADQSRRNEHRGGRQRGAQMTRRLAAHLDVVTQVVEIHPPFVLHPVPMVLTVTHKNLIHLMNGMAP